MMKKLVTNYILFATSAFALILLSSFGHTIRQPHLPQFANRMDTIKFGDTTAFYPDTIYGWGIYSSYLQDLTDSVDFELILFRDTPAGEDWAETSKIGTIKQAFTPQNDQVINYEEYPRSWKIIIQSNSECSLQLASGPPPQGQRMVLPVMLKYKK